MWYVKRELGMSTLFVGQEKKSQFLPESYSPDVHRLRAQNHEMEQWILNWRVALPRAMQNVSSGDSSNSRKAPSLNVVFLHAFLPFSTFENVLLSGSHMKRITFILITGLWSEIGMQWGGLESTLGLLWNRLIWNLSLSTTPQELAQDHTILKYNDLKLSNLMLWLLAEWQ